MHVKVIEEALHVITTSMLVITMLVITLIGFRSILLF